MKRALLSMVGVLAMVVPAASFAASVTLTNGGLGQVASNPSQFGVAVCNGGAQSVNQSVPVTISVNNGQIANITSASAIAAGACQYSYVSYSQLNMQAGQNYSVSVTIDSQKTLISNSNNQATYSVTVPAGTPAVVNMQSAGTANVNAQSGNILVRFWDWLKSIF